MQARRERDHQYSTRSTGGVPVASMPASTEKRLRATGRAGRPAQRPRRSEFDDEYEGRTVKLTLHNGTVLIGRVETSKYWLKLQTAGSSYVYVNKAYVVAIEPLPTQ